MDALAEIISRYDIVAIQELSQKPSGSGECGPNTMSAICDLLEKVRAVSKRDFAMSVSPRIGDEQYTMMFDAAVAGLTGNATYPDTDNKHSRPPHAFRLSVGSKTFSVAVTHTKPGAATTEIQNFPDVMKWMKANLSSTYGMIVGDFNADGSYFNEDSGWDTVMAQMTGYTLLTDNDLDTTVASSSNTYDRIIASESLIADSPA